jgi:hypothetical protein
LCSVRLAENLERCAVRPAMPSCQHIWSVAIGYKVSCSLQSNCLIHICFVTSTTSAMSRYVLLLLTACHSVVAAQNAACSSGLYKQLASYSVVKPVSSFCLSKFPPQTQTSFISTATTTTTTTTLIMSVCPSHVYEDN